MNTLSISYSFSLQTAYYNSYMLNIFHSYLLTSFFRAHNLSFHSLRPNRTEQYYYKISNPKTIQSNTNVMYTHATKAYIKCLHNNISRDTHTTSGPISFLSPKYKILQLVLLLQKIGYPFFALQPSRYQSEVQVSFT